jgi:hypothetical protein
MKHAADDFSHYALANKSLQGRRSDSQAGGALRALRDPLANFNYVAGMAGGSLVPDLKEAPLSRDTLHVVLNGERSLISTPELNDQLASMIRRQIGAVAIRMTVENGTHPMANHYGLNASMIKQAIDEL